MAVQVLFLPQALVFCTSPAVTCAVALLLQSSVTVKVGAETWLQPKSCPSGCDPAASVMVGVAGFIT